MSENKGSVQGKVFVVTGGGRGIGREIALLAAREGARVVVNDLGASPDGEGKDLGPAEEVVQEIKAAGGQAVVNGDSVADAIGAARIVQCASDSFGRVDVVVNNAGILRDRIFYRMSREDWDAVIQVHLSGSFYVARAAAPFFKEQNSGSYVHFTSTSGLIGNVGQANYGAAKMGIIGLSKLIALDMQRFNVRSNCIAPAAWSRLIGTIPAETEQGKARLERVKAMSADKIAPVAVYLGSDAAAAVNGQVFGVRKNEVTLYSQPRPIRSVHRGEGWSVQTLAEHGMPALKGSFVPLHSTSEILNWEAV